MDNFDNADRELHKENIVAGVVGAFLFSLAGAVVYFLLHLIGYIASISGLVGAVCAVKGYSVFSKKESKKGIAIAAVISLLVIVIAWFFSLAYDVYDVYKAAFESGEIDYAFSYIESVRLAPEFLKEPDVASAYYSDLGLSLFFCVLGSGSYIINKIKNANVKKQANRNTQAVENDNEHAENENQDNATL